MPEVIGQHPFCYDACTGSDTFESGVSFQPGQIAEQIGSIFTEPQRHSASSLSAVSDGKLKSSSPREYLILTLLIVQPPQENTHFSPHEMLWQMKLVISVDFHLLLPS